MIVKRKINKFGDEVIFVDAKTNKTAFEVNHTSRQIWRRGWNADYSGIVEITDDNDDNFDSLLAEIEKS